MTKAWQVNLAEILDLDKLHTLLDSFCRSVGVASAIIDPDGNVLVRSKWQELCTEFHRPHPETYKRCVESDTFLANRLQAGEKRIVYTCHNGLTDAASPIMVEGHHIANLFVGQFLLAPPDMDRFKQQALSCGFQEAAYLGALSSVPVVPEDKVQWILQYLVSFAELLGDMGFRAVREREASEASRRNENLYRALVDNINLGITLLDRDHKIVMINKGHADIYKKPVDYFYGKYCYREFEKRDHVCRHCPGTIAMQTGRSAEVITQGIHDDGTTFDARVIAFPLLENGNATGFIEVVEDITEQKAIDEQLRRSRIMLDEAQQIARIGSWEFDFKTNKIYWSEELFRILGYCPGEVEPSYQAIAKRIHPDDLALFASRNKNMNLPDSAAEYRIMIGGDTTKWLSARTVQELDDSGDLVRVYGIIQDITERKQAEIKLNESRDFLKNIFKTSADGILIVGKYSIITMANDAAEKILGYTRQELIGKALTDFDVPGDMYDKKGIEFITRLFEEGSVKCFERQFVNKDGYLVDVELSAAVRKDPEGNIIDSVAVLRDITDRKRAEEEKNNLQAQLSRSEKMETIGLLAGGVAHDLNNMLGAIVGYPELILDDLPPGSTLRPAIKAIKESGERAAAIVQDLLTLTRRGVTVNEIINLNAVVQKYFESPEWEKLKDFHPHIAVQQNLEPTLLNLVGSPVHVSKVIANLVSNAAEAMPQGGTIEIMTQNRHLDTPLNGYDVITEGDYIVISVSDNGIGIPAEDLQRIFEPFYTKKIMGRSGTGLGMSVVWSTVKDHRGYIDIVSKQGRGTTMTLYFPATRKEFKEQESTFSFDSYIGHGETILVVDDVESQRDIARAILRKLRYRVEAVASGEEAVEYLKSNTADLLVLDMIMDPGMDGLETYQKVLGLHPQQKAIIVSGYSETDRVVQAQALGAGTYVKKPYTIEKLGQAARNELHRQFL